MIKVIKIKYYFVVWKNKFNTIFQQLINISPLELAKIYNTRNKDEFHKDQIHIKFFKEISLDEYQRYKEFFNREQDWDLHEYLNL